jgi:hypothetical protein
MGGQREAYPDDDPIVFRPFGFLPAAVAAQES